MISLAYQTTDLLKCLRKGWCAGIFYGPWTHFLPFSAKLVPLGIDLIFFEVGFNESEAQVRLSEGRWKVKLAPLPHSFSPLMLYLQQQLHPSMTTTPARWPLLYGSAFHWALETLSSLIVSLFSPLSVSSTLICSLTSASPSATDPFIKRPSFELFE